MSNKFVSSIASVDLLIIKSFVDAKFVKGGVKTTSTATTARTVSTATTATTANTISTTTAATTATAQTAGKIL